MLRTAHNLLKAGLFFLPLPFPQHLEEYLIHLSMIICIINKWWHKSIKREFFNVVLDGFLESLDRTKLKNSTQSLAFIENAFRLRQSNNNTILSIFYLEDLQGVIKMKRRRRRIWSVTLRNCNLDEEGPKSRITWRVVFKFLWTNSPTTAFI